MSITRSQNIFVVIITQNE